MARRRMPVLPAGVAAFERTVEQWRQLQAPSWVFDLDAAALAYVTWGRLGYGGGCDPDDELVRRHYAPSWMARCVKPQYLAHADALSDVEAQLLLLGDQQSKWGRPGRCWSRMLDPAADVPSWLACCRAEPRRGTS